MIKIKTLGAKAIFGSVQNLNATKHSFTIQPFITINGVFPILLICFYEPAGAPKKFYNDLSEFKNLSYTWSKSGLLTSELEHKFLLEEFTPIISSNSIFIHDSWNGFKRSVEDPTINAKFKNIFKIPPKTTPLLQPLDVYYNLFFKQYLKLMHNYIRIEHSNFKISNRKNIALLVSLTHSQFCSPPYANFIKYAWYKSGLLKEKPDKFMTPLQYSFGFSLNKKCFICKDICFIKCANCKNFLCFYHFVTCYHINCRF